MFPEPPEFCLGKTFAGIEGSGAGRDLGADMAASILDALGVGLMNTAHFEELVILGGGIGVDRISDICCNILKEDLIAYTQKVAARHGIPLVPKRVRHARWDSRFARWSDEEVLLPNNPHSEKGRGVILVPERFVRTIPVMDAEGFWEWAWSNEGESLRNDFNYEVARHVDRKKISELARRRHDLLRRYIEVMERSPGESYDVKTDPDFILHKDGIAQSIADTFTLVAPKSPDELVNFTAQVIDSYKAVLEASAWKLMWSQNRARPESGFQELFKIAAHHMCVARDVDLSSEPNAGRGPVDFKLSRGAAAKCVVELKLVKSSSFFSNLEHQAKTYAKAENCKTAFFVAIQLRDEDLSARIVARADEIMKRIAVDSSLDQRLIWVDARQKPSASKIRS